MSTLEYSEKEIGEVWTNLRSAETELEQYDTINSEKKKELIERIRDNVQILVTAKSIPIKENQISSYVLNILEEKGVSYSKGHWHELFKEHQKRNYSNSPKGEIHEHDFKIISDNPTNGKWEQCDCGINKINNIIQIDQSIENNDDTNFNGTTIKKVIEPEGIEFELLLLIKEQYLQSVSAIDLCFKKCTIDKSAIEKQTILKSSRRSSTQEDYTKLLNSTTTLADKRISIVRKELSLIATPSNIKQIKKTIAQLIYTKTKLNDKTKITQYEKSLAKILIERFAYDHSDIAKILNINTKHVKNNIMQEEQSIFHRIEVMKQLRFLERCPGCGVGIADNIEEKFQLFKAGKTISEDFDLENFALPSYAKQCDELLEKNRLLRKQIIELKQN